MTLEKEGKKYSAAQAFAAVDKPFQEHDDTRQKLKFNLRNSTSPSIPRKIRCAWCWRKADLGRRSPNLRGTLVKHHEDANPALERA